jgi:hypothetical protein
MDALNLAVLALAILPMKSLESVTSLAKACESLCNNIRNRSNTPCGKHQRSGNGKILMMNNSKSTHPAALYSPPSLSNADS